MKKLWTVSIVVIILISLMGVSLLRKRNPENDIISFEAKVIKKDNDLVTVKNKENEQYTFKMDAENLLIGSDIKISCEGTLVKTEEVQSCQVTDYEVINIEEVDLDLFYDYYELARKKMQTMSLNEKIGQMLLVRYGTDSLKDLSTYNFGGFIFYAKDFQNKTKEEVKQMIEEANKEAKIPLITAVDEEGGSVVRVSSNKNLRDEPFASPSEVYKSGGIEGIKEDTLEKSKLLYSLGLNLNLAPVVDVSYNDEDYIYDRTVKLDTQNTANYAKAVIEASKKTGVSYALKHFPGYGNNVDTHTGSSTDMRSLENIFEHDIPPFKEGIEADAECVLISHNIVTSIDNQNPASLSLKVHQLLTEDLNFSGITITDDLEMGATSNIENKARLAVLAGNDLLITTDYKTNFQNIKEAIDNNIITMEELENHVLKILAWKYYKGLITEYEK